MDDIARAILSSLFYATELSDDDKHEVLNIEISPDDFQLHFHKIMAHLFNHLKEAKEPITFDVAFVHLNQQNVFNQDEVLNIMSATPFGTRSIVEQYLNMLRIDNKKSLIGRI